jgi:cysteine desulfuration protein SufE
MLPPFNEIVSNFELLDDPTEQFEYLIELGRMLPPMAADLHTDEKLVPGCQSKVWLDMQTSGSGENAVVDIAADSDAHITKGLVAFLVSLYSGQPARAILQNDALQIFRDLGLGQHITSKRSNGLRSMVDRIRGEAARVAAAAA